MSQEQIIKQLIASRLNVDISKLDSSASLVKDLKADSLDTVELVMDLEELLDVKIGDQYLGEISTVQHIIDIALKLIQERDANVHRSN